MGQPAIRVQNLAKYFPPAVSGWQALLQPFARATQCALDAVSFTAESGQVTALVGANGAGKSTLLRILATLLLPGRGAAFIGGFDVVQDAAKVRMHIGYHTGGDEGHYTRLTARHNLKLFAAMNNLAPAPAAREISRVAELLGLVPWLELQVRTFSTGMLHRLGLARALLHRPAVLLLDEPTRSLDPLTAAEFRRFLKNDMVRRHGATLLFASHALDEVNQLADTVLVLQRGRLLARNSPAGLCREFGVPSLAQALAKIMHSNDLAQSTDPLRNSDAEQLEPE